MRYITTHDGTELLMPNNDYVFKLIFADPHRKALLKDLLKSILDLPDDEFDITVIDPVSQKEQPYDKPSVVDVKMTTPSGKIINIEMQVAPQNSFAERICFGLSKLISDQIVEGENWSVIRKAIGIAIVDFDMWPNDPYCHHRFGFYDKRADVYFGDVEEINTIELKKALKEENPELRAWAIFIGAKTEDDIMKAVSMKAGVQTAYNTLGKLSRDPKVRDAYEQRVKFEATKLSEAEHKYKPLLEERDRQIAVQAGQLAKERQLNASQAARIAELERQLAGK
jgi:predicted transposase/invertase (TIGR01784 family)